MAKKNLGSKLPERQRRERLLNFLTVLGQDPRLEHFRTVLHTGPERQLALFAALERHVVVGPPAVAPPRHDDELDQLLCDVLEVIDSHPDTKDHRLAYYGPDRHLANLQALGLWRGDAPIEQPSARELFATAFSNLTADAPTNLSPSDQNNSPALQDFSSDGELFGPQNVPLKPDCESNPSPQTVDGVLVLQIAPHQEVTVHTDETLGLNRHTDQTPGEKSSRHTPCAVSDCLDSAPSPGPSQLPHRPVRRGRPIKLDDMAKGRLLGLMSYGLSFRQAAAQLGVHHQTLLNALRRDEEFAQQVSEARLDAISQPLLTVIQAARTSWRAAAWLAKFLNDRRVSCYETTPEERALDDCR